MSKSKYQHLSFDYNMKTDNPGLIAEEMKVELALEDDEAL